MNNPTFVPTVVTTKASVSLDKQVAEELKVKDPSPEKAIAKLRKPDEHRNTNQRQGQD